jgi:hypothetical protein
MRALALIPLAALALAAPSSARAEDDKDRAVVVLSNGERAEGKLSLTEGKSLEVFDKKLGKRVGIAASEVVRISVSVESEKLEQAWIWKEEGSHEKILLPDKFPARELATEVTLLSGEVLRGHAACVLFLDTGDEAHEAKRFLLLAQQKGEKNERLEDLVYVKEVVFPGRKAAEAAKVATIQAPAPAAAVSLEREVSFESPLTNLLQGRYDVFLFMAKLDAGKAGRVRFGLTGEKPADTDRKKLEAKLASIEEFYTKKQIVAATKDGGVFRVFLELTRAEAAVDGGGNPAPSSVRWELWTFEPTQEGVSVRARLFLHRITYPRGTDAPAFDYVPETKLAGVRESAVIE